MMAKKANGILARQKKPKMSIPYAKLITTNESGK